MKNRQYYGGAIWTNHALSRLDQRGLTQEIAVKAFKYPDNTKKGKKNETFEYQKKINNSLVTVIAKQNERREWLILSCWVKPLSTGSLDLKEKEKYEKYQQASFWGKLWLTLIRQLGF